MAISMGGVAEDEDALAGQVGRVDRARPPRLAQPALVGDRGLPGDARDFFDEVSRGPRSDRNHGCARLAVVLFQPAGGRLADFRVEHHVEMCSGQAGDVGGRRAQRCAGIHGRCPAPRSSIISDLTDRPCAGSPARSGRGCCRIARAYCSQGCGQPAHDLVEGLARAPASPCAGRRGQFQRNDGDRRGSAPRPDRPGSSWINSAVQDAPTMMACGSNRSTASAQAVLKRSWRCPIAQITGLKGRIGHRRARDHAARSW